MANITIKKLVAFAVLMEKDEGVKTKSPTYIAEKWRLVQDCPEDLLPTLMDPFTQHEYYNYLNAWKVNE